MGGEGGFCVGGEILRKDLTTGSITGTMLRFALPMIAGNLLQQCYNLADTFLVGRFIGSDALAAVGSSYTLMTFLTSILLGLSMGSGAAFSIHFGAREEDRLKSSIFTSFVLILAVTVVLNVLVFVLLDPILVVLQIPASLYAMTRDYLWVIFWGISATFLYNFFASLLRALGNSATPLIFLGVSAVLNIVLDVVLIVNANMGVAGAALATVIAQFAAGLGLLVYALLRCPQLRLSRRHLRVTAAGLREIANLSFLTCLQQSVMNFGILAVQGLVNSFGPAVMAAFAAAVKIDSFAYMPVQDFGNAFSTFIAQNYGAGKEERIRRGARSAVLVSFVFCVVVSVVVFVLAEPLLHIFIDPAETAITAIGVQYLRIEGAFYCGIGCLFLLYGYFRAVRRPGVSLVLTIVSLGTRVALAFALSAVPWIGVVGIWASVPIGWFLADALGLVLYRRAPLARELTNSEA